MCTREELRGLLRELLVHIDRLAFVSAKTQYNNENYPMSSMRYSSCYDNRQLGMQPDRFKNLLRFQKAQIRYFVFALDPFTEIIVPLSASLSSLELFMTNIIKNTMPQYAGFHTSRTIVEFLQMTNADIVQALINYYKSDLLKIIAEMRLPFDIDTLTKIRRDCYRNMENQGTQFGSAQNQQVQQIARQACYLFHDTRKELTLQPMEFENDGIFVPGNSATFIKTEDLISFSSLIHSIPMAQNDENIMTGDVKNPQTLYFYTPMDSLDGIPSNNLSVSADVISFNNPVDSKMTMDMGKSDTINTVSGTSTSASQISNHQLCAGCGKTIQDRYLLKALDMLWHEDCLKCGCCDCRLGEVGSTLYTKGNLMLCKRDYLRLFGNTGLCAACNKVIPAFEMVMRARQNVYHLECFACQQCSHRFCVGDRFYLCENKILCEYDYEERLVFASIGSHPMLKRHANSVAQNSSPTYVKGNTSNMETGGNSGNGVSNIQQQRTILEQTQAAVHHHHQIMTPQQQQQHQKQHDDHNNNNNQNCALNTNQFNLMKIPHST